MRILKVLFLLNLCWRPQALNISCGEINEISKMAIDAVKSFSSFVGLSSIEKDQAALYKMVKDSHKKIQNYEQEQRLGSKILKNIQKLKYKLDLTMKVMDLKKNIRVIMFNYKKMRILMKSKKRIVRKYTLEEFAHCSVTGKSYSIQGILNKTHALIAPSNDPIYVESVFQILIDIMKVQGNAFFCKMQTSAQQLLLHLYYKLALTEHKGFLLMQFSYRLLTLRNIGNFTREIKDAGKLYTDWSLTLLNLTIEAVKSVTTELWKCDPEKQVKKVTYIEITELLQAYVGNEVDLNEKGSCAEECNFYNSTKSYRCDNPVGLNRFCSKTKQCKGEIFNCQNLRDSTVCFSPEGTNRYYEYIGNEKYVFGRLSGCAGNYTSFKGSDVGMWNYCGYCLCYCDEPGINSDRYFSVRPTLSNITDNNVVTGLRFVKRNRIIHLQIQEGKLLPHAKICEPTVRWQPIDNWRLDDWKVENNKSYYFHMLLRNRSNFDLDDLVANDEEVLTGVRFRSIGSHLNFQIHVTPFNLESGKLEAERSYWKEEAPKNRTKKVDLSNKDIPIRTKIRNLPTSESGMYLQFTHTSLEKDVAQTTVPFVDCQAVESWTPVPLSGAGVMHKGSEGYGGFISLKIMTYNFSKVIRDAYDDMKVVNPTEVEVNKN